MKNSEYPRPAPYTVPRPFRDLAGYVVDYFTNEKLKAFRRMTTPPELASGSSKPVTVFDKDSPAWKPIDVKPLIPTGSAMDGVIGIGLIAAAIGERRRETRDQK